MLQRLGKYEILRPLGQGAMGEVFLAFDRVIGREVALKKILPTAIRGAQAEQRFRREAAAAGQLNHPNVVTIFDFDKHNDVHFLVMEYIRGMDLNDRLELRDLSQGQCLEVLAQVCEGLAYAHRNGVIHQDIKPSNIRVVQEGERLLAKVMDFGIAKAHEGGGTASGLLVGTVDYMAPEYIRTSLATPQSDLYSVGVVLYECLTGTRLFVSDSTTTTLFKIVTEAMPPLDPRVIRGISPHVAAVLERALAKDPKQRFVDGDDFAKALRACKDPSWSGASLEVRAARTLAGDLRTRRLILFTIAGLLAAIALAVIAVHAHHPRTSAPGLEG